MSETIESIKSYEYYRRLMRLADAQEDFMQRYSLLIEDPRRSEDFRRELIYLIHLAYREAQEPLVKQLTDFVMTCNRPLIFERDK